MEGINSVVVDHPSETGSETYLCAGDCLAVKQIDNLLTGLIYHVIEIKCKFLLIDN